MSASSLRYQPAPDRNGEWREQIVRLAHRHRRYGAGMIYLKLRQVGHRVNHKRVKRLYALEKLQGRGRKKIPISERKPFERPLQANAFWPMDFPFDRVAGGRAIKNLTVVDDATHEAVAVVPEHNISGVPMAKQASCKSTLTDTSVSGYRLFGRKLLRSQDDSVFPRSTHVGADLGGLASCSRVRSSNARMSRGREAASAILALTHRGSDYSDTASVRLSRPWNQYYAMPGRHRERVLGGALSR